MSAAFPPKSSHEDASSDEDGAVAFHAAAEPGSMVKRILIPS